jgi:kinetochore protein Mis13/DSN1
VRKSKRLSERVYPTPPTTLTTTSANTTATTQTAAPVKPIRKTKTAPLPPPAEPVAPRIQTRRKNQSDMTVSHESCSAPEETQLAENVAQEPGGTQPAEKKNRAKRKVKSPLPLEDERPAQKVKSRDKGKGKIAVAMGEDVSMGNSTESRMISSAETLKVLLPTSDTPINRKNQKYRAAGGAGGRRRSSLGLRGRRSSSMMQEGIAGRSSGA